MDYLDQNARDIPRSGTRPELMLMIAGLGMIVAAAVLGFADTVHAHRVSVAVHAAGHRGGMQQTPPGAPARLVGLTLHAHEVGLRLPSTMITKDSKGETDLAGNSVMPATLCQPALHGSRVDTAMESATTMMGLTCR